MSSAKIVGIHGGRSMSGSIDARPLPVPLTKLRDEMKVKLKGLIQKLFENADDALFAMADKSGSNGDQTIYFDAMRELRLQKKVIATKLVRGVIKSFNELGRYRSKCNSNENDMNDLSDWDDLSLVQNDDLELNVAMEGMVSRLRNASGSNLNDLKARVESLMPGLELAADQTPLSPEMLCDCFSEGCSVLEVEIKVRLVVFKLFEKYVLSEIPGLYSEANKSLIQQGVLPTLKAQKINVKRANTKLSVETPANPSVGITSQSAGVLREPSSNNNTQYLPGNNEGGTGSSNDDVPVLNADQCLSGGQFESIRELMHPQQIMAEQSAHQQSSQFTQGELVAALSGFQQKQLNQPSEYASNSVIDYRMLLKASLPKHSAQAKYSELDSDVINLVSMLFEFILDDRQLQPVMKVLLSRLQIPMLKVAIMDRSFFDRSGHPARKLLNEIASAAIGWNEKPEGKPDRLKDKVEETIQTILTEFDNDQSLFTDLLASFTKFIDLESRRGQLVEQRTKDSERGKAANDVAKKEVQEFLDSVIKAKAIPDCVVALLYEAWNRLMVLYYLKEGKKSNSWRSACDLVKDLVWTVCPDEFDGELRTELLRKIPGVMRRFRTGLKEISFDEFRANELLELLEAEHIKILEDLQEKEVDQKNDSRFEGVAKPVEDIAETAPLATVKNEEQDEFVADFMRETLEMEEEFKSFQAQSNLQNEEVKEATGSRLEQIEAEALSNEEIVLSAVEKDLVVKDIDEDDPFVQQVLRFSPGCWFEFQTDSQPERCKLAAIIKTTGKYIFVNRSGVKVAEKTKSGLAVELKRGAVQVLNDGLLFDRALESVIGSLRGRSKK